MKKRILIIGNSRIDFDIELSEFVNNGEETWVNLAYKTTPGGELGVAGVAITRLGGEAILCGCVGDDQYGKDTLKFYEEVGMDTRFIKTCKGEQSPICLTMDNEASERRRYASTALREEIDAELVEDAFTSLPDAVYVSLDIPPEAAVRAAQLAREKKIPAFFDGERITQDFPLESLGVVDVLALDSSMVEKYTGIHPTSAQSNLCAAVELYKTIRAKTYLFKYGVGGAFAFKGNFSYYIPYVEGADKRYNEVLVPAMIVETLRSGKSVRAARYASTVIAFAAKKDAELIASIPSETELLRYILEYEVEL